MSNTYTANGHKELITLIKASNNLFKDLQDVTKTTLNILSPQDIKEAEKLIENLGARDLQKIVKEINKRIQENKG